MKYLKFVLILLVLSCARESRNLEMMKSEEVPAEMASNDQTQNKTEQDQSNYIIKTAGYKFQVEDVSQSTKAVQALVAKHQAFIADMNLITNNTEVTNNLIIRVPSKNFETLLEDLGKEAIFTNFKRISAEDVTEEFVDIESRLRTKKEVRDRYIDILKNKAKTVEDVLKAEEQIRILQEEIEAKEGRLKYLQSRVSLSTINLEMYQKVEYQETPDTYQKSYIIKAKQGFSNGWDIVKNLALFVINIWPIIIIGILVYWRRGWIKQKLMKK